ncbi:E3 ubiquitin-protein ligase DOA10 [Parabacteroides sp. PF5-9]|nr:E3 ubiquitin-protein ligase DOA10 [Parabacteroides sp. PF5-9]
MLIFISFSSFIFCFQVSMFSNYQAAKFSSLIISKFPKPETNLKNAKSEKQQVFQVSNFIDRLIFIRSAVSKIRKF